MTLIIAVMNRFVRHQIGLKEARQKFLIAAAAMYIVGHATTFAAPSRLILSWRSLTLLPSKTLGSAYTSVRPSRTCFTNGVMCLRLLLGRFWIAQTNASFDTSALLIHMHRTPESDLPYVTGMAMFQRCHID